MGGSLAINNDYQLQGLPPPRIHVNASFQIIYRRTWETA
jgi:hypothetical protein